MFRTAAGVAIMMVAVTVASAASAQSCGDREEVVSRLGAVHAERLVAAGLQDENHVVEVWASQDGTTWTILLSRADGISCIMGAGAAWLSFTENQLARIEG